MTEILPTDSFNDWRLKTNAIGLGLGDATALASSFQHVALTLSPKDSHIFNVGDVVTGSITGAAGTVFEHDGDRLVLTGVTGAFIDKNTIKSMIEHNTGETPSPAVEVGDVLTGSVSGVTAKVYSYNSLKKRFIVYDLSDPAGFKENESLLRAGGNSLTVTRFAYNLYAGLSEIIDDGDGNQRTIRTVAYDVVTALNELEARTSFIPVEIDIVDTRFNFEEPDVDSSSNPAHLKYIHDGNGLFEFVNLDGNPGLLRLHTLTATNKVITDTIEATGTSNYWIKPKSTSPDSIRVAGDIGLGNTSRLWTSLKLYTSSDNIGYLTFIGSTGDWSFGTNSGNNKILVDAVTATTFTGALVGNASSATQVQTSNSASASSHYLPFIAGATGGQSLYTVATGLRFTPSTKTLSADNLVASTSLRIDNSLVLDVDDDDVLRFSINGDHDSDAGNATVFSYQFNSSVSFTSKLKFNTAAISTTSGELTWNSATGSLSLGLDGTSVRIGESNYVKTYGLTASVVRGTLIEQSAVEVSLADGNAKAQIFGGLSTRFSAVGYNPDGNQTHTILGLLLKAGTTELNPSYIATSGLITDIQTNGLNTTDPGNGSPWETGNTLYANPLGVTASHPLGLTTIKPLAPYTPVKIGYIKKAHASTGSIFIDINFGSSLFNNDTVQLDEQNPPFNGQILAWSTASNRFYASYYAPAAASLRVRAMATVTSPAAAIALATDVGVDGYGTLARAVDVTKPTLLFNRDSGQTSSYEFLAKRYIVDTYSSHPTGITWDLGYGMSGGVTFRYGTGMLFEQDVAGSIALKLTADDTLTLAGAGVEDLATLRANIVSPVMSITSFAKLTPLDAAPAGVSAGSIACVDNAPGGWSVIPPPDGIVVGDETPYLAFYTGTDWRVIAFTAES
jgi:hypothetical protein